jgi:hypothetical protein
MATKVPRKIWKQTSHVITLEPVDNVIREIEEETRWNKENIQRKLIDQRMLIRIPGARYHIYRDCLE